MEPVIQRSPLETVTTRSHEETTAAQAINNTIDSLKEFMDTSRISHIRLDVRWEQHDILHTETREWNK
jgi:hypothetical protein